MFRDTASRRSIRDVLEDKTGTGVAEALGGIAIVMIAAATLTMGVASNLGATQNIATKAERQQLIAGLVGDKHEGATWGTPEAPSTETVTLPNGVDVRVTTWRETTPTSTRLTAVTPTTAGPDAADCTGPADVAKSGCVYASRVHAGDLDTIEPHAIIRKDPSTAATPVGTVDARVSTEQAVPQGTTFATGRDDTAPVWRYLISARSLEGVGEVRITQAGKTLAQFPVETTTNNYFGTFTADLNVPVTATVTSGNVVVKTVFIYRAGSTS